MAITKERIRNLLDEYLQDSQLFLVEVLVKQGNSITVILDGNESVAIEDCVDVSRFVEKSLDRDVEDFELKVMSAGADAPFTNERQYRKNIGKKVRLLTSEEKKIEGILTGFDGESVTMEIEPKLKKGQKPGKNRVNETMTFPLTEVKEAKRVIAFS